MACVRFYARRTIRRFSQSLNFLLDNAFLSPVREQIDSAMQILIDRLREMQTEGGYWLGRLSNSSLSTATAISALAVCLREHKNKPPTITNATKVANDIPERWGALIERGSEFLCDSQNGDGGFGDTDRSRSNIATTLLVIAAWKLAGKQNTLEKRIRDAEAYVDREGKWDGLRRRYGKDKTFVVPILSNCALAGMVPWTDVSPLPFEAAALPQSWYRFAQMPVVSYAIPALVAIGQARFIHAPPRNPIMWLLRRSALQRTRRVLRRMQPDSGGYLEATPLTSFVLMNLASIGMVDSEVAVECRKFIIDSVQADGSWPIDTNLATWGTSLAIHGLLSGSGGLRRKRALVREGELSCDSAPHPPTPSPQKTGERGSKESEDGGSAGNRDLSPDFRELNSLVHSKTIDWLLSCQHRVRHPFTGAEPGGWGWTNLSGAVPDADDTPAALLALHAWQQTQSDRKISPEIASAVKFGIRWLLKLQNRDGGWPTFCRGWGKLPFDRSGADLTAHALRALAKWTEVKLFSSLNEDDRDRLNSNAILAAMRRGLSYLRKQQRSDGSWLPLWFGNQDQPDEENPVYGTGRVLLALGDLGDDAGQGCPLDKIDIDNARRGVAFLLLQQNQDGGWGGGVSVRYGSKHQKIGSLDVRDPQQITSTIEETSVAIEGLAACGRFLQELSEASNNSQAIQIEEFEQAIDRGVVWLTKKIQDGGCEISQPIGFYFAKLWYHERLYPFVFAAAAIRRVR